MNNLVGIEPRDLYQEPISMAPALAVAKHMAETAALMRRWPEMEAAIDILIERQQVVVQWWRDHVRAAGHQPNNLAPALFGVKDAEQAVGLRQQQISRFRTSLADVDAYRARLIARVHRSVDPPDPSARHPTPDRDGPDFWPTPQSLVAALVDHVLPLLPRATTFWECAAGDGRVADAIAQAGHNVIASDLFPQDNSAGLDFLNEDPPEDGTIVVTNPPYNASDAFIRRGLSLLDSERIDGLALLLRHDHLQAGTRVDAFNRATHEVHCNWRPIWIDGTEGQPRWSFHWLVWTDQQRQPPLYLRETPT